MASYLTTWMLYHVHCIRRRFLTTVIEKILIQFHRRCHTCPDNRSAHHWELMLQGTDVSLKCYIQGVATMLKCDN